MVDLRVERAKRRMSQQDVADAIHISRVAYNKIENGISQPRKETVMKLIKLFGLEERR